MSSEADYILQMKDITKTFPGVKALDNVSFNLKKGSVHALMGENGAGKSTLMKVLTGIYKADAGEIILKGARVNINDPKEALHLGISIIHQELNPIPDMTVAENIFVGREPTYKFLNILNRKELRSMTLRLFEEIGIKIDPGAKLASLSVAEKQVVEIVKAISYNADIIIMDEPTSAISDREVEKLFEIIRKLVSKGKAIIYISHKMDEIFQISDYITVMRDGAYIDTKPTSELNKQKLISLMVGRELSSVFPKRNAKISDIAMEVKKLNIKGICKDITFKVRRGEILGVAGLMGAGRTEVMEAIFGARKIDSGEIIINGERVTINSPKDAINKGIALVTEDRKLLGLNLKSSVKNNITLANLSAYCMLKQLIRINEEKKVADAQIDALSIKTPDRNQIVNSLSGGNQQKVVIAKWLLCNPDILILDEPTRGIDVGAKAEIYKIMNSLAEAGKAIIMISSEMPEILGMSDRVIALHEGRITGEFDKSEMDQEKIMFCATGHEKGEAVSWTLKQNQLGVE